MGKKGGGGWDPRGHRGSAPFPVSSPPPSLGLFLVSWLPGWGWGGESHHFLGARELNGAKRGKVTPEGQPANPPGFLWLPKVQNAGGKA